MYISTTEQTQLQIMHIIDTIHIYIYRYILYEDTQWLDKTFSTIKFKV